MSVGAKGIAAVLYSLVKKVPTDENRIERQSHNLDKFTNSLMTIHKKEIAPEKTERGTWLPRMLATDASNGKTLFIETLHDEECKARGIAVAHAAFRAKAFNNSDKQ